MRSIPNSRNKESEFKCYLKLKLSYLAMRTQMFSFIILILLWWQWQAAFQKIRLRCYDPWPRHCLFFGYDMSHLYVVCTSTSDVHSVHASFIDLRLIVLKKKNIFSVAWPGLHVFQLHIPDFILADAVLTIFKKYIV